VIEAASATLAINKLSINAADKTHTDTFLPERQFLMFIFELLGMECGGCGSDVAG
jgi:hypothetical protein